MRLSFFTELPRMHAIAVDAAPAASAPRSVRLTLRAKGAIACIALLVYILAVGVYVTLQRDKLLHIVQQMDFIHEQRELLTRVNTSLAHSIVALQYALNLKDIGPRYEGIRTDLESLVQGLPEVQAGFPSIAVFADYFERQYDGMSKEPSREALLELRDAEQQLAVRLEQIQSDVQEQDSGLVSQYADLNQYITLFVSAMNLFGLTAFGIIAALFLSRLASDVNQLKTRAQAIVSGYRGPPLEVLRHDEVGTLMDALNSMQLQLRQREHQQEVSRQQRFHQEKMAAVGSLAAAVAHEVSNPINSISGIAQHTIQALRTNQRVDVETLCANAELTLTQTERIGSIMRRLADLSAPRSPDPELIDVNELVKITCNFVRYDRRLRHVELESQLDHDLPAVRAVADHLTQILMNLLLNAADAVEGVASDRKPSVVVSSRQLNGEVVLSVSDNGHGMEPAVLAHAFEESFTTKPAGKGRGIGLYLSKTLIEEIGGRIELESTLGVGTTARVCLPQRREAVAG